MWLLLTINIFADKPICKMSDKFLIKSNKKNCILKGDEQKESKDKKEKKKRRKGNKRKRHGEGKKEDN